MRGLIHFNSVTCLCILAAFAIMAACEAKSTPSDILTRQEMVKLMEELYVAEEKVNFLALSRDSSMKVFSVMQSKVFQNAAKSDTIFKKSLDYYMERPKDLELIYTALVDTLQLREQRAPFRPDQR